MQNIKSLKAGDPIPLTVSNLLRFAKRLSRLDSEMYFPKGGPVCPSDREAMSYDRNHIRRARYAAKKAAGMWWHQLNEPLKEGSYSGGRLIIEGNKMEYTAGQYAPTEIWWAIEDYFLSFSRWVNSPESLND